MSLSFPSRLLKSVPGPEESPPGLEAGASSWGSASVELVLPMVCLAPLQVQTPQSVQSERSFAQHACLLFRSGILLEGYSIKQIKAKRNIVLLCGVDVEWRRRAGSAALTRCVLKSCKFDTQSARIERQRNLSRISSVKDRAYQH